MKIVMASSGFTNNAIIRTVVDLVGKKKKDINFAIINEAIKGEPGDHRWFCEALDELADAFSGGISFVDLVANKMSEVKKRLMDADVVFCFGGNADYLTNTFNETGFSKILPEILAEKVWVGSSAGSCVLGHKESSEFQAEIFHEAPSTKKYLEIVPVEFLPHFEGRCYGEEFTKESIVEESRRVSAPVYALTDDAALVVEGEEGNLNCRMVGRGYIIAQNGTILSEDKRPKFSVSIELGSK